MKYVGSAAFFAKEKLKNLKVSLHRWKIEVFGWINLRVEDAAAKINVCHDKFVTLYGEEGSQGLVSVEVEGESISKKRLVATRSFWKNLQRRECLLKQKSRVKWCRERDLNTRFFHNVMKSRVRSNVIGSIAT